MEIFLGYPSEHRSVADEIYRFLGSLGHSVWMDTSALVGGTEWRREREQAQRNAKLIIHLCAEEMMSRPGDVNREIKLTLDLIEDQPLGALYAVFIRLSDFRLPVELTRFQYIDKFRDDWSHRLETTVRLREKQLIDPVSQPARGEVISETQASHSEAKLIEVVSNEPPDEASAQYLQYDREGVYWQWINSQMAAKALGGFFAAIKAFKGVQIDAYPESLKERSLSWQLTTEEFFLNDRFLSVRFYTYSYFGGAHPNHYVETLNFAGPEHGQLQIETLLDNDFSSARRLIDYCERVVGASVAEHEYPADFHLLDKDDEEEVWQALGQFNLDNRGVTFNFSPYDVMAYAFGSQTVIVPWETMQGFLGTSGQAIVEKFTSAT